VTWSDGNAVKLTILLRGQDETSAQSAFEGLLRGAMEALVQWVATDTLSPRLFRWVGP
jgi:hypothetical protein